MKIDRFTPGPWHHQECYKVRFDNKAILSPSRVIVATSKDPMIATVWGDNSSMAIAIANARLIAAAPDLLNACLAMLATWGSQDEDAIMKSCDQARDVVYRALV